MKGLYISSTPLGLVDIHLILHPGLTHGAMNRSTSKGIYMKDVLALKHPLLQSGILKGTNPNGVEL
jgi:hypothetical protein